MFVAVIGTFLAVGITIFVLKVATDYQINMTKEDDE